MPIIADPSAAGRATLHRLGGEDQNPDLLFIHGFGSDRYSWLATAPAFFETHAAWAVELPGHTDSPIDAGYGSATSMALAVTKTLAGQIRGTYTVVGHSLGGMVALALAKVQPDQVSRLILLAPAGLGPGPQGDFLTALPALQTPEQAQALLQSLVFQPKLIRTQQVLHLLTFLQFPGRRKALEKIACQLQRPPSVTSPPETALATIWGREDRINPLTSNLPLTFTRNLYVLPETGHLPQIEQARKTNEIIRSLLPHKRPATGPEKPPGAPASYPGSQKSKT